MIAAIVDEMAPNLVARNSIGHVGAAQLLLTAGDNPERLRSEASFASLCALVRPRGEERSQSNDCVFLSAKDSADAALAMLRQWVIEAEADEEG
jgi:hypothetical protein